MHIQPITALHRASTKAAGKRVDMHMSVCRFHMHAHTNAHTHIHTHIHAHLVGFILPLLGLCLEFVFHFLAVALLLALSFCPCFLLRLHVCRKRRGHFCSCVVPQVCLPQVLDTPANDATKMPRFQVCNRQKAQQLRCDVTYARVPGCCAMKRRKTFRVSLSWASSKGV